MRKVFTLQQNKKKIVFHSSYFIRFEQFVKQSAEHLNDCYIANNFRGNAQVYLL